MARSIAVFLALACAMSCTTGVYTARYDLALRSAQRDGQSIGSVNGTTFDDDLVHVRFSMTEKQIGIMIQNKTAQTQRIVWEHCRYVAPDGNAYAVTHQETGNSIAAHATLLDFITPETPLPSARGTSAREVRSKLVRGPVSLIMDIDANGVSHEYVFEFALHGEALRTGWSS